MPIVFEDQHFCISLCTIHTTLLDYVVKGSDLKTVGEYLLDELKENPKVTLENVEIEALYNKHI